MSGHEAHPVPPDADRPRVLTVSGVDPCGGAGLVADVRAIEWAGGFAMAVPTCTTVQDRSGLRSALAVDLTQFIRMLEAVAADGPVAAVKTGLFVTVEHLEALARWFGALKTRPPLVVDPVLSVTAGGGEGVVDRCVAAYRAVFALGAVVTPNLPELRRLADGDPRRLLVDGADAVLVKGGHGEGTDCVDRLFRSGCEPLAIARPRLARQGAVHGTGCFLAATLAARLAAGDELVPAVRAAGDATHAWIAATPYGRLPTPLAGRADRD